MFGFNIIEPMEITDAVLTATNATDAAAAWVAGAYADGVLRTHADRIWESLVGGNAAEPGTDDTKWLDTGPTNRRAMFDGAIQSQTVQADEITVELAMPAGSRVNTLFAQNVDASSAEVVVSDSGGVIDTRTQTLVDNSGVTNIGRYLFLPLRRRTYALFADLPNYAGLKFAMTLAHPGGAAKCGDCVIGRATMLGTTQFGGEIGLKDFSVKERDDFGGFRWVERAFASTGSFALNVLKGDTDLVCRLLTEARASRRVYIAYAGHAATIINGVVTEWRGVLSTPSHRVFNCSFESLA